MTMAAQFTPNDLGQNIPEMSGIPRKRRSVLINSSGDEFRFLDNAEAPSARLKALSFQSEVGLRFAVNLRDF